MNETSCNRKSVVRLQVVAEMRPSVSSDACRIRRLNSLIKSMPVWLIGPFVPAALGWNVHAVGRRDGLAFVRYSSASVLQATVLLRLLVSGIVCP